MLDKDELNPKEKAFVAHYVQTYDRTKAAIAAGYAPANAYIQSYTLLSRPIIRKYIEQFEREQERRLEISADDVIREHYKVLSADPNSVMQIRRIPCRYCWGVNGEYQYTKQEMERRLKDHSAKNSKKAGAFDPEGGDGYSRRKPPNMECTECEGDGVPEFFINDSRFLDADGRALYAGFEIGRGGQIKVLMRSKDASLEFLTKRFSLDKKAVVDFDPENMTEDELDAVLESKLKYQQIEHQED
jgi:hypothetical protein